MMAALSRPERKAQKACEAHSVCIGSTELRRPMNSFFFAKFMCAQHTYVIEVVQAWPECISNRIPRMINNPLFARCRIQIIRNQFPLTAIVHNCHISPGKEVCRNPSPSLMWDNQRRCDA